MKVKSQSVIFHLYQTHSHEPAGVGRMPPNPCRLFNHGDLLILPSKRLRPPRTSVVAIATKRTKEGGEPIGEPAWTIGEEADGW